MVTLHAHERLVGGIIQYGSNASADPMFPLRNTVSGDILEDREVLATGTYHATLSISASTAWIVSAATFRAKQ